MAYFSRQPYEILIILLWGLVHLGWCETNCEKESCSNLFQKTYADLLTSDSPENICRNIKEVSKCISSCSKEFFSDFILFKSNASILNEICEGILIYDLTEHWKCLRQHMSALVTCIASSGSIYADKSKQNVSALITCKKLLQIFRCPQEVIYKCGDKAVESMEEIFRLSFYSLLQESCFKVPVDRVSNLKVHHRIDNKYSMFAACMDKCPDLAINSFAEYMKMVMKSDLSHCSENDADIICKESSSSSTCPPSSSSSISGFYPTIFTHGKNVCKNTSSDFHQFKVQPPEKSMNIYYQNDLKTQENASKVPSTKAVLSQAIPSSNNSKRDMVSNDFSSNGSSSFDKQANSVFNSQANSQNILISDHENITNLPVLSKTTPDDNNMSAISQNVSDDQPDILKHIAVNITFDGNQSSCVTVYLFHAYWILIIEAIFIILSGTYTGFNVP